MDWERAGGYVARALSFRVMWWSFWAGVAVAMIFVAVSLDGVAGYFGVATMGVVYLGHVLNEGVVLFCENCGKLVKVGFDTCHHCGHVHATDR